MTNLLAIISQLLHNNFSVALNHNSSHNLSTINIYSVKSSWVSLILILNVDNFCQTQLLLMMSYVNCFKQLMFSICELLCWKKSQTTFSKYQFHTWFSQQKNLLQHLMTAFVNWSMRLIFSIIHLVKNTKYQKSSFVQLKIAITIIKK